ncbi:MAG: iron ABC transporter permease [Lentisphaeria bacterium]|nr:iron ABC transporter permease [Lentisphaeria bacterium]
MIFRRFVQYFFMLLLVVFLALFLVLPVFTVIGEGCQLSLIAEVFRSQVYLEGLFNSLAISVVTTLIVAVISLILALVYDRYEFFGKEYCSLLMLLPMILPPFVGAIGFQQILGYYGVVNTILVNCGLARIDFLGGEGKFWSVCIIEALHLYPVFYLNLITALGNIDPALSDAAANLGATPLQRFFRIKLPLLKSGFLAGGSIVMVWSFTELGTPLMFGYNRVTPVQVFNGLTELENNPMPYALVVVMLAVSALIYLLMRKLFSTPTGAAAVKGSMGSKAVRLQGMKRYLPTLLFALAVAVTILPHLALTGSAFSLRWYDAVLPEVFTLEHFDNALSNPLVLPSIVNSLRYSVLAMIIAVFCGVAAALISVRWKLKGAWLVDLLTMLPLAIPGLVIAFGFLGMTGSYAWARKIFNPVDNPLWLLAIAYAVRRIPYVVRAVVAGLEQTPEELELAARNFGAGPVKTLTRITFPLIGANLLVGGLFAFSFSMLEVSDSLILAQKSMFFPITKALLELSQILGSGPASASAFGVWAMAFLAVTLASAGILMGRRIGAIFKF